MNMMSALIGYTGFVGSNLLSQTDFTDVYNSSNIENIRGKKYDMIVCAGLPAAKWIANKHPEEDELNMLRLWNSVNMVEAKNFILISTVDIYPSTTGVTEDSQANDDNHAYGKNRLRFEKLIEERFARHLIIRLPGLFGKGLKKNIIFDLINKNQIENIDPNGVFQYYCLDWLWKDIQTAIRNQLKIVNFVTEPIGTNEILNRLFANVNVGDTNEVSAKYDIRTKYDAMFNGANGYIRNKSETLSKLEDFINES